MMMPSCHRIILDWTGNNQDLLGGYLIIQNHVLMNNKCISLGIIALCSFSHSTSPRADV